MAGSRKDLAATFLFSQQMHRQPSCLRPSEGCCGWLNCTAQGLQGWNKVSGKWLVVVRGGSGI